MDNYTKAILTIIACALVMITVKLWEPQSVEAVFADPGPTLGDLLRIRQMEDPYAREDVMAQLSDRISLSYVWFLEDGTIDVYVKGGGDQ